MLLHPGEIEATGWRVEKLVDVLGSLAHVSPDVSGRPRIIAIDGRGGAGKTTLVQRLQAFLPMSAVVHTDDIAWNEAFSSGQICSSTTSCDPYIGASP